MRLILKTVLNFKFFLLLAILIHGFIIINLDLSPIIPPPPPSKILVLLHKNPIHKIKINTDTDIKITRLTKALEKKFNDYAKRPRRRAISTNTKDPNYANYLEAWRRKVETVGNQNYPETARILKLHGDLILQVTLQADGSVQQIRIVHSSGNQILDDAAIRIVQLAAPYAPFPEEIRKEIEILDITRTWQFISTAAYSKSKINGVNRVQSHFSMLNK